MRPESKPPLIVLVGPTAVGKTTLAISLAKRIGGAIISADSRLFYRGLNIGTAKPTLEEQNEVPHHLIDVADPDDTWSLVLFQREANKAIAHSHNMGLIPLLVGGTGQYIRAITEGWEIPLQQPDTRLRTALESMAQEIGSDGLHARLEILDPEAAEFIDARNIRRTVRAIEVILKTGRKFSSQRGKGTPPYEVLQIGLIRPRSELYARIDARIQYMLAAGWLDEIRGLLEAGYNPSLPSLSAIGYHQLTAFLQGEIALDEAVIQIKRQSRLFVRRQANWFKKDNPQIHWFDMGPETLEDITYLVGEFLNVEPYAGE